MSHNRITRGRGQGLPGNADFRVQDLQDGDLARWDDSLLKWVREDNLDIRDDVVVMPAYRSDLPFDGESSGAKFYSWSTLATTGATRWQKIAQISFPDSGHRCKIQMVGQQGFANTIDAGTETTILLQSNNLNNIFGEYHHIGCDATGGLDEIRLVPTGTLTADLFVLFRIFTRYVITATVSDGDIVPRNVAEDPVGGAPLEFMGLIYTAQSHEFRSEPDNVCGGWDGSTTAGDTRLLVYDVDSGAQVRVSVGAPDSAGAGFKTLRIPN